MYNVRNEKTPLLLIPILNEVDLSLVYRGSRGRREPHQIPYLSYLGTYPKF